ncbi:MAG: hypothetical protein ACI82Z_001721, partial [Cellvibrionaceae bacterium]
MSIKSIEILKNLASTSLASYVTIDKDNLKLSLTSSKLGGDFTDTQANNFIANYKFIHQLPNTDSGFSATIFQDQTTGKKVLAIRGTEFTFSGAYADLIQTDFLDIGPSGYADNQSVDLYRYWKQLITPAGEPVEYTTDELVRLYALENGPIDSFSPSSIVGSLAFTAFRSLFDQPAMGLGLIDADEQVDVTGHSLGGHLAYVFDRLFPEYTDQVVT